MVLTEVSSARAYGDVVSGLDDRTPLPLFASQPVTGVSRRRATLPSSDEVAPVVVAYLRQVGAETVAAREIEVLMAAASSATVPARSRDMMLLVGLAVLLFVAAFAVAFALLPVS